MSEDEFDDDRLTCPPRTAPPENTAREDPSLQPANNVLSSTGHLADPIESSSTITVEITGGRPAATPFRRRLCPTLVAALAKGAKTISTTSVSVAPIGCGAGLNMAPVEHLLGGGSSPWGDALRRIGPAAR